MKKAAFIIPILFVVSVIPGLFGFCNYLDRSVFESSAGLANQVPWKPSDRGQCEDLLGRIDYYKGKTLPLEGAGVDIPLLRQLLYRIGFTNFRISEDQKRDAIAFCVECLRLYSNQDFGDDTAKWREYLGDSGSA